MAGEFSPAARAAVLEATLGRCAGCGAPGPLNVQHRRARMMGGTTRAVTPADGVALCGSGTTGCHGWATGYPALAGRLGWVLGPSEPPAAAPFWARPWGWVRWVDDGHGWLVEFVHDGPPWRYDPSRPDRERVTRATLTV